MGCHVIFFSCWKCQVGRCHLSMLSGVLEFGLLHLERGQGEVAQGPFPSLRFCGSL